MNTVNATAQHKAAFLNRPLVFVTLSYTGGIVLAILYSSEPFSAVLASVLFLGALTLLSFFKLLPLFIVGIIMISAFSGSASFYNASLTHSDSVVHFAGPPVTLEGTIIEQPLFYDDHSTYILQVNRVETKEGCFAAKGRLLVKIYSDETEEYRYGDKLRLRGSILVPRGQRNPGGFNYSFFLKSQGIDALIYPRPAAVSALGSGEPKLLSAFAVNYRIKLIHTIEKLLPRPASSLLVAILFGQREHLPAAVEESFRRAGTGHLMAVSGLHVGLVAALITGLFKLFKIKNSLTIPLAVASVFAYAFLTGLSPSALRAALMASIGLGAVLLEREKDLPVAVACAALITLLINPLLLFTVSFQLSYAAALTIIYALKPLTELFKALRCPALLSSALAVTLSAQLGVLPLCAYYFQHLPTAAIFFNLIMLPLLAPLIGLGLGGALIGMMFESLGSLLLWAARPLLEAMLYITTFSSADWFYLAVKQPGIPALLLSYLLVALTLTLYYRFERAALFEVKLTFPAYLKKVVFQVVNRLNQNRPLMIKLVILLILPVLFFRAAFPKEELLVVTFVDVGQGACALIEAPCGLNILVDAGGGLPFSGEIATVGERTVLPFLRHKRIDALDLAIITHPHEDHFGGYIALVGDIDLKSLLVAPVEEGPPAYLKLLEHAEAEGVTVLEAYAGQTFTCAKGLLLEIVAPPAELIRGGRSFLNDNSIVFRLSYHNFSVLFTGDLEDAGAKHLLNKQIDITADLLLIPHHGGYMESLPVFVNAISPQTAVIQVGNNSFGHPHPFTLETLSSAGIPVYRNDIHGAIIVETDGDQFKVFVMEREAAFW